MFCIKQIIDPSVIPVLAEIAVDCFINDGFYVNLSDDINERKVMIRDIFIKSFEITLSYGILMVVYCDEQPVAFSSWLDYHKLRINNPEAFSFVFPHNEDTGNRAEEIAAEEFLTIKQMTSYSVNCLYLVAIAVIPDYRRKGLASNMVSKICSTYDSYVLCSDISNELSLPIYTRNGFSLFKSENGIHYVLRK